MATSVADEHRHTALAKAAKTGFWNVKPVASGYFECSTAAVLAARYTFFSLYKMGPKNVPNTPLKNPFL